MRVNKKHLLQFILKNKHWKFIKTLFDFGLNCNSTIKNNTDLLFFIELVNKNFDVVESLLDYEININEKWHGGCTPIMATFAILLSLAVTVNESKIIACKRIIYLLGQYKDIKIDSPSYGASALCYWKKLGDQKMTKFLKEKGAKIESWSLELINNNEIKDYNINPFLPKIFVKCNDWINTKLINKIGDEIVNEAVNIATTFFF